MPDVLARVSGHFHDITLPNLLWTFGGLLFLTGLTFGLSFLGLGAWQAPVAIAIAMAKGLLITLFFMGLVEHQDASWVMVIVGLVLALLLVGLAAADLLTRNVVQIAPPLGG